MSYGWLITAAKSRTVRAVNTELIELHWEIGKIISEKISRAEWGDGVVDQPASYIAREPTQHFVGSRGQICSGCGTIRNVIQAK